MELRFEWDPQKAARNLAKHGVSFEEAATVFGDPLGRITSDLRHSVDEERFVLLGLSRRQRLLAVMFAERGEAIRVISARPAIPRERRDYEQRKAQR
ncbi:MAG: BrnT family toxin [Terriglobia bacterium]